MVPPDRLRDHVADRHPGQPCRTRGHHPRHSAIEDRLHWTRDIDYDKDHSQIRTASAPQVMATLRTSPSRSCAWLAMPASPPRCAITPLAGPATSNDHEVLTTCRGPEATRQAPKYALNLVKGVCRKDRVTASSV